MAKKSVEVIEVSNFTELLSAVESFQSETEISWYRGCTNIKYELKPSLFRHGKISKISELNALEKSLTTRFVQRSLPFLTRPLTSDWDKLFLMQHYGIPTRLLDWSENPFVAIYFALSKVNSKSETDAVVWMCNPTKWNRCSLSHISFSGEVLDESSDQVRQYSIGSPIEQMPMKPIMIYGTYNSPRIVAQRGGFALFGQGLETMEKIYEGDSFEKDCLKKLKIPRSAIPEMRNSLFRKGFTESVVYPDFEGLSAELKRTFGF